MHIACPNCNHRIRTPKAPPGAYVPSCPKCERRFRLILSEKPPVVSRLAEGEVVHPPPHALQGPPPIALETFAGALSGDYAATIAHGDATFANSPPRVHPHATGHFGADATAAFDTAVANSYRDEGGVSDSLSVPGVVGGYRIEKELGRGAMGAVYLARQLSLDRDVAFKIVRPELGADPLFISRFTREAYAAAQLSHPNIVQVYDMGVDKGLHFFSMEFVRGRTLAQAIRDKGKLDVEAAVGYALQAARGLKHAHDAGLIHRDIKPDNLLLGDDGNLKVADLGLVKCTAVSAAIEREGKYDPRRAAAVAAASSVEATLANVALGTPAYMPPEQAENAAAVDHRADIYSLGCTLYVMLTGKLLYEGVSAIEVMSKHRAAPIVPPDVVVNRVPAGVSEITVKLVAKKPEDRYQDMGEVVEALERLLGVRSSGPYSPGEAEAQALEDGISRFNAAPAKKLRERVILALLCAWVVGLFFAALFLGFRSVATVLLVGVASASFYFLLSGMRGKTYLFGRARELAFTSRWSDIAAVAAGGLLVLVIAILLGLLFPLLAAATFGAAIAGGIYFALDSRLRSQRVVALEGLERLLKGMRLKGVDEDALRMFVAKYSGPHWEEPFEELFGYEAKLVARRHLPAGHGERRRRKFRAWREPLIGWLEAKTKARRQTKERRHLAHTEEAGLKAEGHSGAQAKEKAQAAAEAMVEQAERVRHFNLAAPVNEPLAAAQKRAMIKAMLHAARTGQGKPRAGRRLSAMFWPFDLAFGATSRFLVGALLLTGCLLWANQNGLLSKENLRTAGERQLQSATDLSSEVGQMISEGQVDAQAIAAADTAPALAHKPLNLPLAPKFLRERFTSYRPGVAGLILIASSLIRGRKVYIFAWPAAALCWIGIPGMTLLSTLAGLIWAAIGFAFARTKKG